MHRKQFGQTPIDSQKEQLAKQEEALRQQMAELEKVIADAPKLAEERLERERQERTRVGESPVGAERRVPVSGVARN